MYVWVMGFIEIGGERRVDDFYDIWEVFCF